MPTDRLSSSDKRGLLLWVILGIAGAIFAYRFYFQAFPEASVDFRVSRGEALNRARDFVGRAGEDVSGYQSSIVFNLDDDAKTYLEREVGLKQANQMMSSQLNIWYWDVRFFKPQQEEEFHVRVNPGGQIVGYEHTIPEAKAGASLERAAAQAATESFLTKTVGMDLSGWQFLPEEADSQKRPNRTDWSFTWEKRGFKAKEAPYRLRAMLQGDRPGASAEYLQVPEAWKRSFARLRSGNNTLETFFLVPYLLLLGLAVWFGIQLTKNGQTTWRVAIALGAIVAGLYFLRSVNEWPLWSAGYDTRSSWLSFIFTQLGLAVATAIATALTITLVLPAAEPLYRASQPDRLQLYRVLSFRGLRSKEFFSAAVVGLSMAAMHIGYVVAFYIVASRWLHAWAPQEVNYEESVNTLFPWISGAAIGLLASTNEEFTFRLFAIPFFKRVTGSRWIAVILPAFLWSFLHSNYPQEPPYIRGIEIGLFGIVAGVVMLRWGILATLIWHYTVDASLVGLFLVRSNSLYFKVSGIVVALAVVAPLLFAAVSYIVRGGFEAAEDLSNRAAPAPEISFTPAATTEVTQRGAKRYEPLSAALLGVLAVCLIAGSALVWRVKPEAIGDYLKLTIDAKAARAIGDAALRQHGTDPNIYHRATVLVNRMDSVTNEFLREHVGIAGANEIYAKRVPGVLWRVRYFRDSEPEEFAVVLKPDGSLHSIHHTVAEAAPGKSLSKEDATARAEKYLREEKKVDLSHWSIVEAKSEKKPNRIDHTLTWQENTALDAANAAGASGEHAYTRMELVVLGDEVTNFRTYVKIPDEFERKHEETTLGRALVGRAVPILVIGGLGISALILFLKNLRSETARAVPWKRISRWALWGLPAYALIIGLGNRLQTFLNLYETAVPLKLMLTGIGIFLFLGALFWVGAIALVFGIGWYYATSAFGEERIPGWAGMPGTYYRDALWIGLGGAAGLMGVSTLLAAISQRWAMVQRGTPADLGSNFDAVVPVASVFGGTLLHSLFYIGVVAALASFIAAKLRPAWLRAIVFLLGALALVGGNWGGPGDLAKQWILQAVFLAVLVAGVTWIMRFNLLGGFLALAFMTLVDEAAELLSQVGSFYRANGYGVVVVVALAVAWPAVMWLMRRSQPLENA